MHNKFVVLIEDPADGIWMPKVLDEREIGDLLVRAFLGEDVNEIRVFDVSPDGIIAECDLVGTPLLFDSQDYADMQTAIVLKSTHEQVGTAFGRVDGRA